MSQDCPTCNQPIFEVRGAIAEMERTVRKASAQTKAKVLELDAAMVEIILLKAIDYQDLRQKLGVFIADARKLRDEILSQESARV